MCFKGSKNIQTQTILLSSKTLGTKCIGTLICNVLANHDQNLESRLRLLKVYLFVKLETSDCGIYWSKFAGLDRSKIRLNRSNLVQINFLQIFSTQRKPSFTCKVLYFTLNIKGKTLITFLMVLDVLYVKSVVRSRGVYLHTYLRLSRSRFMSRT